MSVLLVTHESSEEHRTPHGHPERVDRVRAVIEGARSSTSDVVDIEAGVVDRDLLREIHDLSYIDSVEGLCLTGGGALDPDTYVVPESFNAALHAAGAGTVAVDALRGGEHSAAFVAVRPPGHHAEQSRAMGFCLFNNIAVTAAYLRSGGERVAIVDWDVHHGNGTQRTFYSDPDILYLSIHEFPFYPGTGWVDECGEGEGSGTIVNIPLPRGTDAESYLTTFGRLVVPVVEQFDPDWILISNGYDAHISDPIGGMALTPDHYMKMASWAVGRVQEGRVVAMLEGGYDLDALKASSSATVEGLSSAGGDDVWPDQLGDGASKISELVVENLSPYWDLQ